MPPSAKHLPLLGFLRSDRKNKSSCSPFQLVDIVFFFHQNPWNCFFFLKRKTIFLILFSPPVKYKLAPEDLLVFPKTTKQVILCNVDSVTAFHKLALNWCGIFSSKPNTPTCYLFNIRIFTKFVPFQNILSDEGKEWVRKPVQRRLVLTFYFCCLRLN